MTRTVSAKGPTIGDKLELAASRAAEKRAGRTIYDLLVEHRAQVERALPKVGIGADRLLRMVQTQIRLNPTLGECTPASILGAVMLSAQLGLEPGPLGHAYLVPFMNGRTGRYECQFILGYKGLISLAWRSGGIVVSAYTVRQADLFEFDNGSGQVRHTYKLSQPRGDIVGFWAKAQLPNGLTAIRVMSTEEIEAHRAMSQARDSGPWRDHYEAMAQKTCIRVLISHLPLGTEATRALAADEQTINYDMNSQGEYEIVDAQGMTSYMLLDSEAGDAGDQ